MICTLDPPITKRRLVKRNRNDTVFVQHCLPTFNTDKLKKQSDVSSSRSNAINFHSLIVLVQTNVNYNIRISESNRPLKKSLYISRTVLTIPAAEKSTYWWQSWSLGRKTAIPSEMKRKLWNYLCSTPENSPQSVNRSDNHQSGISKEKNTLGTKFALRLGVDCRESNFSLSHFCLTNRKVMRRNEMITKDKMS